MSVSTVRPDLCLWCGHQIDPTDRAGERRVRCCFCGADTTYPYPTSAELDAAYETWYRPSTGRFSGPGDLLLRRSRGQLAKRLCRIAPAGAVLDVGFGVGALLEALRARGRTAVGIERSPVGVDGVAAAESSAGRWGAVVFWHSLEHLAVLLAGVGARRHRRFGAGGLRR